RRRRRARAAGAAASLHRPLSDAAPDLWTDRRHRRARLQSVARLYRAVVVWSFRLFRHRRLFGRVSAALCRHSFDGALCPHRAADRGRHIGPVRLHLRAAYANLLRHSDTRAVAGAVDPRLQIFLGHWGSDGLRVARPTLLAGMLAFTGGGSFQRFINAYYYYVLGVFAICVVIMWVIVHSPFGKALQAIRDNETRAAFLGLRIRRFRWVSFLISGTFTGLAGILWVPLNGLTTPEVMYWPFSGEIVFMTLLGGFRNFTGPIVGGLLFTYLKTYAVATTEYWQLLLGVVLVLLVMLLPTGIVGAISAVAD